jgi:hypothetical protein
LCDAYKAFKRELRNKRIKINETMDPALKREILTKANLKHHSAGGWNNPKVTRGYQTTLA